MAFKIDQYEKKSVAVLPEKLLPSYDHSEKWYRRDISFRGHSLTWKSKEFLFQTLSILLTAGMDLNRSLSFFMEQGTNGGLIKTVGEIKSTIVKGSSFSDALQSIQGFDRYEIISIQIAEETGELAKTLEKLSVYYNKKSEYRSLLLSALAYPAFILLFSVAVIWFLLSYLVPMFQGVYDKFNGELPKITQGLIEVSAWLQNYGQLLMLFLLTTAGVLYLLRKKKWLNVIFYRLLFNIPFFGKIIQLNYFGQIAQNLSMLLAAQVPIRDAINNIAQMSKAMEFESALAKVNVKIEKGESFWKALKDTKLFPQQFVAFVQIGEESNRLHELLLSLETAYSKEAKQKMETLGAVIEPVLIVFLGGVVGFVLIATYLPLFKMTAGG